MNILTDICLAFFISWAAVQLKNKKAAVKTTACIMIALLLVTVMFYGENIAVDYGTIAAVSVAGYIFCGRIGKALGLAEKWAAWADGCLMKAFAAEENLSGEAFEEDFMKTKQGKILTAVCVLLVIYMIGSAFAIYRLNAKINSVYQITQELSEQ